MTMFRQFQLWHGELNLALRYQFLHQFLHPMSTLYHHFSNCNLLQVGAGVFQQLMMNETDKKIFALPRKLPFFLFCIHDCSHWQFSSSFYFYLYAFLSEYALITQMNPSPNLVSGIFAIPEKLGNTFRKRCAFQKKNS